MKKNEKGFGAIEILVGIVLIGLIGTVGWLVYDRQKNKTDTTNAIDSFQQSTEESTQQTQSDSKVDPNEGYLVLKQWGLRFKQPSDLSDVRYIINGEETYFYAKPAGYNVEYRSNYKAVGSTFPKYALGVLYRSTKSTEAKLDSSVKGKKIGKYYYYTAWSFSSLATGAAFLGLYSDSGCDQNTNMAKCKNSMDAEGKAFQLVNKMLETIEPAQ